MPTYATFSDDSYTSNLAVYTTISGKYVIEVASDRPDPAWDPYTESGTGNALEDMPRIALNLGYDGQTFEYDTEEECAAMINTLYIAGYTVPEYTRNYFGIVS